jgi:hypothetical protein
MAVAVAIGPAAEGRYQPAENCGFPGALLPAGGVGVLTRPRSQNGLAAILWCVKAADDPRLADGVGVGAAGCYGGLTANILDEADVLADDVPSAMLDERL